VKTAVSIEGLVKIYRGAAAPALDLETLEIPAGSVFGLLGPNGAGKTTLVSILCGILDPTRGSARIFGRPVARRSFDVQRRIGFVPQSVALYPTLTVRENLEFFGALYAPGKDLLERRIEKVLALAGLENERHRRVGRLSGGMRRRLNLAAGCMNDPELLFLDEPTVGMDPRSRRRVYEKIRALNREGATIVYTTHYMEEIPRLCDRVAILDRGRLLEHDTPRDILKRFGGTVLEVEIDSPLDPSSRKTLARDGGWRFDPKDPRTIRIAYANLDAALEAAIKTLHEHGRSITHVNSRPYNLEDVFLERTGRSLGA
jgi:ABC-2 type transport system ATP-binding protein